MKNPIKKAIKLATAEINGKSVDFFEPPHMEPDFPWVDVFQLARAFLSKGAARAMLKNAKGFDGGKSAPTLTCDGVLVTIQCHAMAQGMCGGIDNVKGNYDEDGPVFKAYTEAAGIILMNHTDMTPDEALEAFNNPGGPFM